MKKVWIEGFLNVMFWILTAWLIIASFSIQSQELEFIDGEEVIKTVRNTSLSIQLLICIVISMLVFYGNLILFAKRTKGRDMLLTAVLSIGLFTVGVAFYHFAMIFFLKDRELPLPPGLKWGVFMFYYSVSVSYGIGKLWLETERQRQKITMEKTAAELTLLRNQLQPHFLFNVLNNLLSLVDQENNPRLADALDRLSGLLRYVVYDTTDFKVDIRKELDFIKNYSELQLMRFDKDEVDFSLDVVGIFDKQQVEPGIFIPFVENAFKYGVMPERRSPVTITFDLKDPGLVGFNIVNLIIPELQSYKTNGTGLRTTKERLSLIYPDRYQLKIEENEFFKVDLKIITDESNNSR